MNRVTLMGRLGRDPEMRDTQSGSQIANINLATDERRKVDGEWQKHTEWHRLVAFGKTAEVIGRYLTKGRQIVVEGRLQTRTWEKDGEKKYSTEVVIDQMHFTSDGNGNGQGQQRQQQQQRPPQQQRRAPQQQRRAPQQQSQGQSPGYDPNAFGDEDVPFGLLFAAGVSGLLAASQYLIPMVA